MEKLEIALEVSYAMFVLYSDRLSVSVQNLKIWFRE